MIRNYLILIVIIFYAIGCAEENKNSPELEPSVIDSAIVHLKNEPKPDKLFINDLDKIKEEGILRAITIYSSTSYFLYRGKPMGFEYELLSRLAKSLNLKLEIIIAKNMNELFKMLNRGDGDIVAHGMTVTEPRKEYVAFSNYLFLTHQVLVQRKPDNWRRLKLHQIKKRLITNPIELIGDTISVRAGTSYYHRLKNLSEEIGGKIFIDTLKGSIATDEIIKMLVEKKIKYTVADNNIAMINCSYYPELDISTPISFSQRISWAVRKNSPKLLEAVNNWIDKAKHGSDYYVIYNKYFKNKKSFRVRIQSEFYSKNSGKISRYDKIIKKYSAGIGWDWRLLSSLIYQESQFNPKARSWANAKGLMQMMDGTAKDMGVKSITNPEDNIRGGTKYLKILWNWWKEIPDSLERLKFVLASYNCGYGHVVDARKLAIKNNKNPNIWTDNVNEFLLKLEYPNYYQDDVVDYGYVRGTEPYNYVNDILERYKHYKKFIPI